MAKVVSKNTAPEMAVRRALHRAGLRFRIHREDMPGNPDLVLPRFKKAIFVNGCFWHWHGCKRSRMPSTNQAYWQAKIDRNVRRDRRSEEKMLSIGWEYCVIWECELVEGIERLLAGLAKSRAASSP